jgi:hypothetical protein
LQTALTGQPNVILSGNRRKQPADTTAKSVIPKRTRVDSNKTLPCLRRSALGAREWTGFNPEVRARQHGSE